MRSRCLLHKNKLEDFANWLESQGWNWEDIKGDYEILRMHHENYREPLIIYTCLNSSEHLTAFGLSYKMAMKFIKEKSTTHQPKEKTSEDCNQTA